MRGGEGLWHPRPIRHPLRPRTEIRYAILVPQRAHCRVVGLAVLVPRRVRKEAPLASGYRFAGVGQCPSKPLLFRLVLLSATTAIIIEQLIPARRQRAQGYAFRMSISHPPR